MSIPKEAHDLIKQIKEKEDKSQELLKKLDTSLTIQTIWPDAFKRGQKCSTMLRRDTTHKRYIGMKREDMPLEGYLKREDGETFTLTREQITQITGR